jgi:hypothetical protein
VKACTTARNIGKDFFILAMIEIELSKGKVTIVDDDCPIEILHEKWHYLKKGYAYRTKYINGKKYATYMHREIMGAPNKIQVDHINGDKLDNRKENLRLCTASENAMNKNKAINNTSGFKGVYFQKATLKFMARISFNNKMLYLGLFESAKEAAITYNEAAVKYHGEFANLNKID